MFHWMIGPQNKRWIQDFNREIWLLLPDEYEYTDRLSRFNDIYWCGSNVERYELYSQGSSNR
jgi:hypothetical protein